LWEAYLMLMRWIRNRRWVFLIPWVVLQTGLSAQAIETEIRKAFEEAQVSLPPPVKEMVKDVTLRRAPDLGLPPDVPLAYRLLNKAAFMAFSVGRSELTVFDAAMTGQPRWGQDPPSAQELYPLLAGVADVLGVDAPRDEKDPAFLRAWTAFVARVYSWQGQAAPFPLPPPGDPAVLDRFLEEGVWRSMGEKASLVSLFVHEFAHALQLGQGVDGMGGKMATWASLSGFIEVESGKPADGFSGGHNATEDAMVLIRLILSDDPDRMPRGSSALFEPTAGARFVNRYARYDLREDYAESFRLMVFAPAVLAEKAPEKFLYLNAMGWNTRLNTQKPGPLWYSGEDLARLLPKASRLPVMERLLGKDGKVPALDSVLFAVLLRAHASEWTLEDLPEPYKVVPVPDDVPMTLRERLGPALVQVQIDGVTHVASPATQLQWQDHEICSWLEYHEFNLGLQEMLGADPEAVRLAYRDDILSLVDAKERAEAYEVLREGGWSAERADDWRTMDRQESAAQRKAGNSLLAARYEILAEKGNHAARMKRAMEIAEKAPQNFDRLALIATAADVAMETRDHDTIRATIEAIPGQVLGAWLRIKYRQRAAFLVEGTLRKEFLAAARKDALAVSLPKVRGFLKARLHNPEGE
jgi:hypothetical protein